MKHFPTVTVLLFFVILREVRCGGEGGGLFGSLLSGWGKGTSEDANLEGTATKDGKPEVEQKEILSMRDKFQNIILSQMPSVPDSFRIPFLLALKGLLGSLPTALITNPLIDEIIKKFATDRDKQMISNADTTDALIFRLMAQKIDEKNLNEFLLLGTESRLVKRVTGHFMKSLQQVIDNFAVDYMENIKHKLPQKFSK